MASLERYGHLASRVCIASIFISSLLSKLTGFAITQQFMASYGFPIPIFFLIIAIVIELAGSVSLITGYQLKNVSMILVCYVFALTFIFHTLLPDETQRFMFFENIAIMGGLGILAIQGTGKIKKDEMDKLVQRGYMSARFGIAAFFLMAALGKLAGFEAKQEMMLEFNIPQTGFVLLIAIAVELIGGGLILWGRHIRYAALILIVYLIPITLILHLNLEDTVHKILFFKYLSVIGCLGLLALYESD